MKKLYILASIAFASMTLQAQNVYLVEHFDYPADAELIQNGWTAHSGIGTNSLTVTDGGLEWSQTEYLGSGVGNAVAVDNTGSDENKPFSSWVTSGAVYASFLMRVPAEVIEMNNPYFFHFGQYENTAEPDFSMVSTSFRARTFVVPGSAADKFHVGLSFNAAAAPSEAESLSEELNVDETYLVVVKYEIVEGADNDLVSLYLFADGDDITSEPAMADIGPLIGTAGDLEAVQCVVLRQFNASQNVIVDGIIAQDSWDLVASVSPEFTGPSLVGPADGTMLDVSGEPDTEAVISWTAAQNAPGPVTYEWQLAFRAAGNFDNILVALPSDNDGSATTLTVTYGALASALASLGVEVGSTVEGIWRVEATSGEETVFSTDTFDIDITRGEIVGVADQTLNSELLVFPNPASQIAFLRLGEVPTGTVNVRIVNQLGQTVRSLSTPAQSGQQIELNISDIPAGLYFTVISIDKMQGVKRLVIE